MKYLITILLMCACLNFQGCQTVKRVVFGTPAAEKPEKSGKTPSNGSTATIKSLHLLTYFSAVFIAAGAACVALSLIYGFPKIFVGPIIIGVGAGLLTCIHILETNLTLISWVFGICLLLAIAWGIYEVIAHKGIKREEKEQNG